MPQILMLIALLAAHLPACAYIGPGLGAGVVGVILGVLGSILLAILAIFWYPIKRLLKRKRTGSGKKESGENSENDGQEERS